MEGFDLASSTGSLMPQFTCPGKSPPGGHKVPRAELVHSPHPQDGMREVRVPPAMSPWALEGTGEGTSWP